MVVLLKSNVTTHVVNLLLTAGSALSFSLYCGCIVCCQECVALVYAWATNEVNLLVDPALTSVLLQ